MLFSIVFFSFANKNLKRSFIYCYMICMEVPLKETNSIRFVIQCFVSFISEKFTDLLTNEQNVYASGGITRQKIKYRF